jgi:hypothetical protein
MQRFVPPQHLTLNGQHILQLCVLSLLCTDYFSNQLGGMNSLLQIETSPAIPLVSKVPTIILGMDVSHGSPGQSDVPSIAAVSY